ncbi:MAG: hypothetical protein H0W84_09125, partial [Bacteroidetes bacterium]|nr:hypothetical protein [Bacteroidota bacterium]
TMNNNCLYCGAPFKAKRTTKKYCSDNCKQLAYFKRNGMVFGMNGTNEDAVKNYTVKPIVKELCIKPENAKDLYAKTDSVKQNDSLKKQSPVIVKETDSILRQGLKENQEATAILSEKQLQELIYRISLSLDAKIINAIAIVKQELDVKYASLYGKPELTQNTKVEALLCHPVPFKGIAKYENEPAIKQELETTAKPNVKYESQALTQNTEKTVTENETHFTVNDKKEIPQTLPFIELSDDEEDKNEGEDENDSKNESENEYTDENEEDDSELYDITTDRKDENEATIKADPKNLNAEESERDKRLKELEKELQALTFNAGQELQENTVTGNETTLPVIEEIQTESDPQGKPEPQQQEKPEAEQQEETQQEYKWVQSKFLKDIENDFEESNGEEFWHSQNPNVIWVNTRLRCVMQNIIRLSEYKTIDRETLSQLNDALNKIINSYSFNNVPSDYPYLQITREVAERMNDLAVENRSDNIPLRINFKAKAKLVSMCYQMNDYVQILKFNEMNFDEAHRPQYRDRELSGISKQGLERKTGKKTESWKEKYKRYVEAGIIKPDDDDEEESDEDEDDDEDKKINYRKLKDNPYTERIRHFQKTGKFPKRAA